MSLTINFENNITGEDDVTGLATGDHASETLGINIYSQIFKRKDAFDAAVKVEDRADLLKILKKVVKCETGKELGYREQVSTYFDNVALEKVASASTESNTYLMQPNQILIFQSKQGPEDTPYYTYYCYFKENAVETATGESKDGNVWVIYIPGPKMSPIVFDLVDSLEPTFEIAGTVNANGVNNLYANDGDSPVSNVYAYFTYKFPMIKETDTWSPEIQTMYGTNPVADRIVTEGKLKNTYSWPCNKPMTISLNKLYYRINNEPYRLCSNSPLDLQFLSSLAPKNNSVYNPFKFEEVHPKKQAAEEEEVEDCDNDQRGLDITDNALEVSIPDLDMAREYNMFFGRLVIVAPKQVRFTTEICYDCVLIR